MSGLTGYLTADGIDLSYVFQPKNSTPATNQNITYSGTNTFTGITTFSNLKLSCGIINGNPTLSRPILNFYHVTSAATEITLPNLNSGSTTPTYAGTFIIFKHTNSGNIIIKSDAVVARNGLGGPTSQTIIGAKVVMVTCNGSAWWIYNTYA
jgi:hypothetical protein